MMAAQHNDTHPRVLRWFLAPRFLMLVEQVLFSGTNFVLTIVLARTYNAFEFGTYGIGLAAILAVQFVQRNLYIVSLSLMSQRVVRRRLGGLLGEHIIVTGGVVGVMGVIVAVFYAIHSSRESIDLTVSMFLCTVIYFQADFDRTILVKSGRFWGATLLSLAYLCVVSTLALATRLSAIRYDVLLLLLSGACIAKGAWIALLRVKPRWRWGIHFLVQDWHAYGVPAILQGANTAGCTHVPVMVLGMIRGSAAVAGLTAMRSLTQPLAVVLRSLDVVDKSRFRILSGGTVAGARRAFWRNAVGYAALGAAAVAAIGYSSSLIIRVVYHGRYSGLGSLLVGWSTYTALLGLMLPLQSVTFMLNKQMEVTRWTVISAIATSGCAIALSRDFGAWGAMSATLIGALLNVLLNGFVVRSLIFGSSDGPLPKEIGFRRLAKRA
jgi:O-antigen/teichoic acid export membrane protein